MVKSEGSMKSLRNLPKKFWDEFVYGGHFLAMGDAVAIYILGVILNIPVTYSIFFVIYLCVFAANLVNRSDESDHDITTNPIRVRIMRKYTRYFYPIIIFCFLVSGWIILHFSDIKALLFAIFIVVVAVLYTVLLKDMTKYIIGFKNIIAAFFYALMVYLLVIYYNTPITLAVFLVFCFYYLRIFINSAACDVKDIQSDKERGLKTLAIYFGKKKIVWLLNFINVVSGLLIIFGVYLNILPKYSLGILLTIPYSSYYLYLNSRIIGKEFFSNVIIDGEYLLWPLFILIGKMLF